MAQFVAIVTKNVLEAITNFEMPQETPKVQSIAPNQSACDLSKTFECNVATMDNINLGGSNIV